MRSDYVPVTIAEGERLQFDVACLCGSKATMGKWTLVIKYFDKNKRELGTLSNNTLIYSDNDYFWVGNKATAIKEVESTDEVAVKVSGSTITVPDDAVTTIYSTDGREVYNGTDNTITVAKGLYIVTMQHAGTTTASKIFIK